MVQHMRPGIETETFRVQAVGNGTVRRTAMREELGDAWATLEAKERPRRDGEDSEPDACP